MPQKMAHRCLLAMLTQIVLYSLQFSKLSKGGQQMTKSSVILKVNDAGEKAIFYLGPSDNPNYLLVLSVNHFPTQHELAAFPKKFVTN
ncbi:hypothetical protein KGQ34_03410, partial [Patescibacteria group bacterium]|nr:hypothetical protein [Patescibacteria group bacterium]